MRSSALFALAACSSGAAPELPRPVPPAPAPTPLFVEHALETAHGLSGLAIDDHGALWTVAERDGRAYRITVPPRGSPRVETFVVDGVSDELDLEGIAWLGGEAFAFGTEGKQRGVATVLLGLRAGERIAITGSIALPAERVGIDLPPNHGAEGVCGRGETIVVAIEGAGVADGDRRWAPLVVIRRGEIAAVHRLWLTSKTGKISALDCTIDEADHAIHAWAIERHFEVTKFLAFDVGLSDRDHDIAPRIALDLGPTLRGRVNLEGIARGSHGTTFAIVDNQWRTITGPSRLLVFPAGGVP